VTALFLLTVAAGCHATWNLLLKKSPLPGPDLVWLCAAVTTPLSLVLFFSAGLGTTWWAALVSMALHTGYAVTLQKAYGAGGFAVVYPVSRGTTPVLVTLATIPWTGLPAPITWVGVALVAAGVLVMDRGPTRRGLGRGVGLGLVVGACSCAYTLWDGYAITTLGVDLLPYLAVSNLAQFALLTAILRPDRRLAAVLPHWRSAVPIAILTPASYGLVLVAMTLTSIETVAAGRTLNVAVGTLLGLVVLRERLTPLTATGLVAVVGGVLLVST
jgi:drug/metabolite transporter (DMT)-like permease